MNKSNRLIVRGGCAAFALMMIAGTARAQNVLSNSDSPFAWFNPFGPVNPDDPGVRINQGNVLNPTVDRQTRGGAAAVSVLWASASASENNVAPRDRFRFAAQSSQRFEVIDAGGANIWAPLWLKGGVNFFQRAAAPNANFAIGRIEATVEFKIFDAGTATYISVPAGMGGPRIQTLTLDRDAQVNAAGGNIDAFRLLNWTGAAAGQYQLDMRLTISGEADKNAAGNSAVGSGVVASAIFQNAEDLLSGSMTALGYAPGAALPDSRARVTATQARADYGVTGAGISIGLLEPGRVIDSHDAFAGGKVTQLRQRLDQPAGDAALPGGGTERRADGRTEHTTAVGAIAAGAAGNNSEKGVAPGASLISVPVAAFENDAAGPGAKSAGQKQMDALIGAGARIINMSARYASLSTEYVDSQVNADPRLLFVKSAGNQSAPGPGGNTITNPGMSYNSIVVGALNQQMNGAAAFSSSNDIAGGLRKPDIVAPGDYVTAASVIDTNGDGNANNDFDNRFSGVAARYHDSEIFTGGVSGTSFAAPHVSGAAALMMEYRDNQVAADEFDARSDDFRVIKAVMLNTATRTGIGGWQQRGTNLNTNQGVRVTESLDRRVGSGLLNTQAAMRNYAAGEIHFDDVNTEPHYAITAPTNPNGTLKSADFWDLERVKGVTFPVPTVAQYSTVNYILGSFATIDFIAESQIFVGRLTPNFGLLKAALTWARPTDAAGNYLALPHLEMRLYVDGLNVGNTPGFDPNEPGADLLLAETDGVGENVKILDYVPGSLNFSTVLGSVLPIQGWSPKFYLQILNLDSQTSVDYGLSVTLPAPGAASVLVIVGIASLRRRRA